MGLQEARGTPNSFRLWGGVGGTCFGRLGMILSRKSAISMTRPFSETVCGSARQSTAAQQGRLVGGVSI